MAIELENLRIVRFNDNEAHAKLASKVGEVPVFWTDANRIAPLLWYTTQFMNANNIIFDVGNGSGVIAFLYTQPGWRSQVYAAKWAPIERGANDKAFQEACKVAMLAHELLVIDAFVSDDNEASHKACVRNGMTRRGRIKNAVCYNGVQKDVIWYEMARETLGLAEKE